MVERLPKVRLFVPPEPPDPAHDVSIHYLQKPNGSREVVFAGRGEFWDKLRVPKNTRADFLFDDEKSHMLVVFRPDGKVAVRHQEGAKPRFHCSKTMHPEDAQLVTGTREPKERRWLLMEPRFDQRNGETCAVVVIPYENAEHHAAPAEANAGSH